MELIFEPLSVQLPADTILRLSAEMICEMTSIAVLGTLAVVNIRAEFSNFVAATDASSTVMAGVEAPIPFLITQELGKHCLRKGVWAKLLAPSRALLREHGLLSCEEEDGGSDLPFEDIAGSAQLDLQTNRARKQKAYRARKHVKKELTDQSPRLSGVTIALLDGLGARDLDGGQYGDARRTIAAGCPWLWLLNGITLPIEDLLQQPARDVIFKLLRLGAFLTMSAAPVCSSFSVAVMPPVRSKSFARG
eukprot:s3930_g3.t1